jgi:predicted helicase
MMYTDPSQMRQSLLKSFDEIYVLNLHGNSNKKERCPDGSKDENVFDIQQGVAIALYLKKNAQNETTHLQYADLWGSRQYKYQWLNENEIKTTPWKSLQPHPKEYLFVPRGETLLKPYEAYAQVTDIFQLGSVAVQTHRDNFAVDIDRNKLEERIQYFLDTTESDQTVRKVLGLKETKSWKIAEKRRKLKSDINWKSRIVEFCFHPFDVRWLFYHEEVVDRDRWNVMQHMLIPNNIGLNCTRGYAYEVASYNYALISAAINNQRIFVSNTGATYFFPLYVLTHPRKERNILIENTSSKKSNVNPIVVESLEKAYGRKPQPEKILYYVYAVLYSEIYRHQYGEFAKTSFPRIPFTSNENLFLKMSQLGNELADLHLLKSEGQLNHLVARFEGEGENIVIKTSYDETNLRVYINDDQYFEGIKPNVWSYQIGGYQVMFHWFKDRTGRVLSLEDIKQYCKIATSLSKTIEIQEKIDEIYPGIEEDTIRLEQASSDLKKEDLRIK